MLPDKMEHCIVFMNSWDVSDVFWSFSKCNITIPHFPTGDSTARYKIIQSILQSICIKMINKYTYTKSV